MGFPGANELRETANYVLLGAPLDISTSFQPGTRFGPREVRHHAHTFDDYDRRTDRRFTSLGVHDAGDLDGWEDAAEYLDFLSGMITDIVDEEASRCSSAANTPSAPLACAQLTPISMCVSTPTSTSARSTRATN